MSDLHTCVSVGNLIQYTGVCQMYVLQTGEIGKIVDILLWVDESPDKHIICLEFEHSSLSIKLSDISPNNTNFRLYHSEEDLSTIKNLEKLRNSEKILK